MDLQQLNPMQKRAAETQRAVVDHCGCQAEYTMTYRIANLSRRRTCVCYYGTHLYQQGRGDEKPRGWADRKPR